jgi:ribonucleoside-diphosphate reductase alpha chain
VEDWEAAVREGEKHGFRNAQATVIAPTGTIGLLMDCDTTGIEPDFSIVKWKKLAGGGVVRIVNRSIPDALANLGYKPDQIKEMITHILGDGTKENPGKETIEGAPHLKEEHYPVFDCANKCGDGKRFLVPMAHVKMMAAVQPFISGAISKTVNCPGETSVEEIEQLYVESWRLGLKAVALYRDGSKGSQPLTTKVEGKGAKSQTQLAGPAGPARGTLEQLPRHNQNVYKIAVKVNDPDLGPVSVHIIFVEHPLGAPKEIFLSVGRNGQVVHETCRDLGMAWSKMLRLGMSVDVLAGDLIGEKGVVKGMTDHPLIKSCLSIKDLVGKILAYEYLNRTEFIDQDLLADHRSNPNTPEPRVVELELYRKFKQQQRKEKKLTEFDAEIKVEQRAPKTYEVYLSKMMGDAPDCNICGHKTVRNAACYKCLNCGNSMGCS